MQRIDTLKREEKFADLSAQGKVKELNIVTHMTAALFYKPQVYVQTVVEVKDSGCHCVIS